MPELHILTTMMDKERYNQRKKTKKILRMDFPLEHF
jgi:hypothetical protein